MMKGIIISCFLCFSVLLSSSAQIKKEDTMQILFDAKIKALNICYDRFYSIKSIDMDTKNTSAYFLSQKGFNDVLFIKVKVRPRADLIPAVFFTIASNDEKMLYNGINKKEKSVIDINQDSLVNIIFLRTFGLSPDSMENDYWESKLPRNALYFRDRKYFEDFKDIYYLYSISQKRFYLLKIDNKYSNLTDDFRRLVYAKIDNRHEWFFSDTAFSIFDDNNLADNPKKKLPNEIFKYIEVEEIGIDFLKQLPPYRKFNPEEHTPIKTVY